MRFFKTTLRIAEFLKKTIPKKNNKYLPLGRWKLEPKKIDIKVLHANEDHCGVCHK